MTQTRQIVLNALCNIFTSKKIRLYPSNREAFQVMNAHIVSQGKNHIMFEEVRNPNEEYGFIDLPEFQQGSIELEDISLIVYAEDQKLKNTPSLSLYRKDDKIEIEIEDIRNWQVGKRTPMIWREATILSTGLVDPNHGERFKPYPYIEYKFTRTYWKGDSDGNGEFYDKESIERAYMAENVRFVKTNVATV